MYGIYCGSIKALTYNNGLLLGIFIISLNNDKYMDVFISWSSGFMVFLLLGAYIGFIYAFGGGQPILSFPNPDGRLTSLYFTTLTNAVFGKIIRPAGIYDEPGAFSFFICSICLIRILKKKHHLITILLLFSGIITLSLTHLLIVLCYLLFFITKYYKKKYFRGFIVLFIVIGISLYFPLKDTFDELLFSRIDSIDDIINNNRTSQIQNAENIMDTRTFFWGRIAELGFEFAEMSAYGDLSSNPLTPLLTTGIIASSVYYLFLCLVVLACLASKEFFFIYLAVLILFLQRPFFSGRSYTIYFVLFFLICLDCIKTNIPRVWKIN
jgi:hypothetical protein